MHNIWMTDIISRSFKHISHNDWARWNKTTNNWRSREEEKNNLATHTSHRTQFSQFVDGPRPSRRQLWNYNLANKYTQKKSIKLCGISEMVRYFCNENRSHFQFHTHTHTTTHSKLEEHLIDLLCEDIRPRAVHTEYVSNHTVWNQQQFNDFLVHIFFPLFMNY